MLLKSLLLSTCVLCTCIVQSQEADSLASPYVKKDFLILMSTKSYAAALSLAKQAATAENIKLDLRGLSENKTSGLSFSKEDCEKEAMEFPAYVARGRWDDGVYISIEYSDAYSGFREGYYIVIAASGFKDDKEIKAAYNKLKLKYRDAYFKSSKVYIGCMH